MGCLSAAVWVGLKVCSEGFVYLGTSCVCGALQLSCVLRADCLFVGEALPRSCLGASYLQGHQVASGSQWWASLEWVLALASS